MEISPDELCSMILDPCESSPDEVLELVDTYLCTTVDMMIESIHKRVTSCADRCKSKKHVYCNRLISSLLHQIKPMRETDFISKEAKKLITQMEALLPKSA